MEQKSLIDTKANFVHFFLEHPIDEVYVVGVRLLTSCQNDTDILYHSEIDGFIY